MMATIGALNVELRTNTAKFAQGLDKANRRLDGFSRSVGRLKGLIGGLFVGFAIKKVIDATKIAEMAMAQLEQAVKSTGGVAGFTAKELDKQAAALQKVSTFGDEAINSMQAILLTFTNLRGDVLPQTTKAVLNLSARMGTDLNSAALQLGKALNDPVANLGALSRAGIQFSKDQKKVIKSLIESGRLADAQGIILKELETQFGGAAAAARDTFGGALEGLGNAFSDLLEAKGGLNEAKDSIEGLTTLLQDPATVTSIDELTSKLITGFSNASRAILGTFNAIESLGEAVAKSIHGSADPVERLQDRIQDLGGEIALVIAQMDGWTPFISDETLKSNFDKLIAKYADAAKQLQSLLQSLQSVVGKEIIEPKIAAKIIEPPPEVISKTTLETAEQYGKRMFELAREAYPLATQTTLEWAEAQAKLSQEMIKTNEFSEDLGFTFSSAFEDAIVEGGKLSDILKALEKDILRIITRKLVTEPLAGGITNLIGSAFGGAKAMGGPVTGGVSYLVGEKGPELFTPANSGNITPNNKIGGATIINNNTFTIQAPQGAVSRESQSQIAASVGVATSRALRRNT